MNSTNIKYFLENNILVIEPQTPSFDLVSITRVKKDLNEMYASLKDDEIVKTIIDLQNVKYVDSSGIGVFLGIRKSTKTQVIIKNASPNVQEVIKLASLDKYFLMET